MPGGGGGQTVNQEPPKYLQPYLSDVARLAQQSFYGGTPGQPASPAAPTSPSPMSPRDGRGWSFGVNGLQTNPTGTNPAGSPASPTQAGGYDFNWPQYYPGSTVVPFAPETQQALDMQAQRAQSGSPLNAAAQSSLTNVLGGGANPATPYLEGMFGQVNPATQSLTALANGTDQAGFQNAFNAARNQITPQVDSLFGRAGRSGSGLAQTAQTQAEADAFANLYNQEQNRKLSAASQLGSNFLGGQANELSAALGLGGQFLQGQGLQNQAAALAPTLSASDYTDIGQLAQVGAQRESMSQQQLQDQINRYNYGQQLPYNMLQQYAGLISGVPAIGGTTTAPGASTGQNLLGGGLAGAGLAQMFGVGSGMTGSALAGALGPWALGGAALMGLLG